VCFEACIRQAYSISELCLGGLVYCRYIYTHSYVYLFFMSHWDYHDGEIVTVGTTSAGIILWFGSEISFGVVIDIWGQCCGGLFRKVFISTM